MVRLRDRNTFILLVTLILAVGIIDYFLYAEVSRKKRLLQEKRQRKDHTEVKPMSESTAVEVLRQLEEGEDSKAEAVASIDSSQAQVGRTKGREMEQTSESPPMSSVSEMAEEPEIEPQSTDTTPHPLGVSSVEDIQPHHVSETRVEATSQPTVEQTLTVASTETQTARAKRTVIQQSAIALAVEDREPKGISKRVSFLDQRVYCWMRVINGKGEKVTVRWLTKGRGPYEAHLPVGSENWRTWSYLTLKPSMIGPARVEILRGGELLETLSFQITE